MDYAARVRNRDVADASGQQHFRARHPGRPSTRHDDPQVADRPAGHRRRVLQRGQYDDRRPVLVVVHDRDRHAVLDPLLHLEASRCADVLQVDAPEGRRQPHDRLDEVVDIGGVQRDRDRVQTGEFTKQAGFAFHHRQRCPGADVAQTEHGGAVGHDRDQPPCPGVASGQRRIGDDGPADLGHSRGVDHGQVFRAADRHRGANLQLPALVEGEDARVVRRKGSHNELLTAVHRWRGAGRAQAPKLTPGITRGASDSDIAGPIALSVS